MAHTLLCGAMQAESIKSSDKHFDSAVSWYEKAISFLPEEERAKPVKQQMQVCWLHCTVAALFCPDAHCLRGASWLFSLCTFCSSCSMTWSAAQSWRLSCLPGFVQSSTNPKHFSKPTQSQASRQSTTHLVTGHVLVCRHLTAKMTSTSTHSPSSCGGTCCTRSRSCTRPSVLMGGSPW